MPSLKGGEHRLVLARHSDDPGQACAFNLEAAVLGP